VIEDQNHLDVWGVLGDGSADIMVRNAAEKRVVMEFFASSHCAVVTENVQDQLDLFDQERANATLNADWFDAYHPLQETITWWQTLASQYPFITWKSSISNPTTNGNRLSAFEIRQSGLNKPWIYFQCQIHAREWISGATCQYIINNLLQQNAAGDPTASNILKNYNIAVVPVVNPDGYAYTWLGTSGDRMWRKNRRANGACYGVDLNRNYNDHWGQGGSSTDPCSETYMGPSVASEPEVQATQNYMKSLQQTAPIYLAIDWHSYSQLVLRPYGWTSAPCPNEAALRTMGTAYADAVRAYSGFVYTSQTAYALYVTTGSASDYFYSTSLTSTNGGFHVAAYTVELRPTSDPPGFILPPAQIKPCGQENYQGVLAFVNFIDKNGPMP
jgi:hypothetical protein